MRVKLGNSDGWSQELVYENVERVYFDTESGSITDHEWRFRDYEGNEWSEDKEWFIMSVSEE